MLKFPIHYHGDPRDWCLWFASLGCIFCFERRWERGNLVWIIGGKKNKKENRVEGQCYRGCAFLQIHALSKKPIRESPEIHKHLSQL